MIDRISLLQSVLGPPKPAPLAAPAKDEPLLDIAQRSFRLALLQALDRMPPASSPPMPSGCAPSPGPSPALPPAPLPDIVTEFRAARPVDEIEVIKQTADRAGIDAAFLRALRRVENGGPGREFGVLSVSAPTYEDQARVAAETIRRNVERFEQSGRSAIDAAGRYTKEFIEFFSSRYAPLAAANDPARLNRHHAGNLIRLYAQAAPRE